MADKKATANDKVLRTMEFKKKGRTGFDGRESLAPAGLPEIDFVGAKAGEVEKPLVVGDGKVKVHSLELLRLILETASFLHFISHT